MLLQDFYNGTAFDAYTYFGAHPHAEGTMFRVYAPGASKVALIGEFNQWQEEEMIQDGMSGIYECNRPGAVPGMMYRYRVYTLEGNPMDKTDPYAFRMELRPDSASIIVDLNTFTFTDEKWMKKRDKNFDRPMNIYELHFGSWKRPQGEDRCYTYEELAAPLIEYVKQHHYTHIELLPLSEHPADCSWGYQVTGFYSPTSRYGTPAQLKYFINECHRAGIGVIMDFVPVHFAVDSYALERFTGRPLYEYEADDIAYTQWGTCNFNYYKGEVRSFLQSCANYWLQEYHCDGIRMDAISNVIYWQGDESRGVNGGALEFVKEMNAGLQSLNPTAMMIAEDSSAYPKVTAPVEYDGLGFDYKWDMGWMNDTLAFFKLAPWERSANYHKLTFSMMYFYSEHYIMAFSHDEVVHGKATIAQKMWGDYDQKFSQCRLLYLYMYTHPGKKLNFMGNEFAQLREWDETREQDWDMLKYPNHDSFREFMKELHKLYLKSPALHAGEYDGRCFRWLQVHGEMDSVYIYQRTYGKQSLVVALNVTDVPRLNYTFEVPEDMDLMEVLNSDRDIYGGNTVIPKRRKRIRSVDRRLTLDLPPFTGIVYEVRKPLKTKDKRKEIKK